MSSRAPCAPAGRRTMRCVRLRIAPQQVLFGRQNTSESEHTAGNIMSTKNQTAMFTRKTQPYITKSATTTAVAALAVLASQANKAHTSWQWNATLDGVGCLCEAQLTQDDPRLAGRNSERNSVSVVYLLRNDTTKKEIAWSHMLLGPGHGREKFKLAAQTDSDAKGISCSEECKQSGGNLGMIVFFTLRLARRIARALPPEITTFDLAYAPFGRIALPSTILQFQFKRPVDLGRSIFRSFQRSIAGYNEQGMKKWNVVVVGETYEAIFQAMSGDKPAFPKMLAAVRENFPWLAKADPTKPLQIDLAFGKENATRVVSRLSVHFVAFGGEDAKRNFQSAHRDAYLGASIPTSADSAALAVLAQSLLAQKPKKEKEASRPPPEIRAVWGMKPQIFGGVGRSLHEGHHQANKVKGE